VARGARGAPPQRRGEQEHEQEQKHENEQEQEQENEDEDGCMAELMGICGADAAETRRVLDRMGAHVNPGGRFRTDRWEREGLGLLRFHHGVINAEPQPIFNEDGSLLAAMDGELFGCEQARGELLRAGHKFRHAANDAEFVLHLYEHRGEAGFRDLTGTFSVVLYAVPFSRLLIVTDPFFSRPVFYCRQGEALVFSSRFNALLACGAVEGGRLDMTGVMQFFTFQHAQYRSTFYEQVRAMLPASVLEFRRGQVYERKYWRPAYGGKEQSRAACVDSLTDALRAAARRLTSDGCRKGVLLSGGVDSRILVAASEGALTAYTVGDWHNREVRTACKVAAAKGLRHVFLQRPPDYYAQIFDEAVELTGGMARFDCCQFLGLVGGIRGECDLLFNEDAMDALFKGYYWCRRLSVKGVRLPVPGMARFTPDGIEEQILRMPAKSMFPSQPWLLFREPWRSRYRDIMRASIREQVADARADDPYNMAEHVGGLASLGRALHGVTCVRPHLEYGALSLDAGLLKLAVRTPVRFRMGAGLLYEALKRLDGRLYAIPSGNTGMRSDTPAPLAWAAQMAGEARLAFLKHVGAVPRTYSNESWPDRDEVLRAGGASTQTASDEAGGQRGGLRSILGATLTDEEAIEPSIFDTERVRQIVEEHMSRKRHHMRMLLCLLTFGRWFKLHGPSGVE
jgi:asparagine synthase (glutamine-hydrolysing)